MKIELSFKQFNNIIKSYYLKKENIKVKLDYVIESDYNDEMHNTKYYVKYYIIIKRGNNIKYREIRKLDYNQIKEILNTYLNTYGYETDNYIPVVSADAYVQCFESLDSIIVNCHEIEKEKTKKIVRKV